MTPLIVDLINQHRQEHGRPLWIEVEGVPHPVVIIVQPPVPWYLELWYGALGDRSILTLDDLEHSWTLVKHKKGLLLRKVSP